VKGQGSISGWRQGRDREREGFMPRCSSAPVFALLCLDGDGLSRADLQRSSQKRHVQRGTSRLWTAAMKAHAMLHCRTDCLLTTGFEATPEARPNGRTANVGPPAIQDAREEILAQNAKK
jgi:hypothetical protein